MMLIRTHKEAMIMCIEAETYLIAAEAILRINRRSVAVIFNAYKEKSQLISRIIEITLQGIFRRKMQRGIVFGR